MVWYTGSGPCARVKVRVRDSRTRLLTKISSETGALNRWVVKFGHQVSSLNTGRALRRRHIPNPSVSLVSLEHATKKWVGEWEDDDDDDDNDDKNRYAHAQEFGAAPGQGHDHGQVILGHDGDLDDASKGLRPAHSWASRAGPLAVLPEEGSEQADGSLNGGGGGGGIASLSEVGGHPLR